MNPTNSLSSKRQENELKDLQDELKRFDNSIADFEEQRRRTLAILSNRLKKEKNRLFPPKGESQDSVALANQMESFQKEAESKREEIALMEKSIDQKKSRSEHYDKEISNLKAELTALEQSSAAFSDFNELQERRDSLAEDVKKLRFELSELERTERELSKQINHGGDK